MPRRAVTAIVVLSFLAGCGALPGPLTGSEPGAVVEVTNQGEQAYTVETVVVTETIPSVTVSGDGGAERVDVPTEGFGTRVFDPVGATDVTVESEAVERNRTRVSAGTTVEIPVPAPTDAATVVVVRDGEEVVGWGVAYCGSGERLRYTDLAVSEAGLGFTGNMGCG